MKHDPDHTIAVLSRTPAALDALLRGLPEGWTRATEGDDTFNAFDILGHLIYAEHQDWMPRLRRILAFGETRAFDPFDRWGHISASRGKTLEHLLDDFVRIRNTNLTELRLLNLSDADFDKRGRHPALGSVTVSELLATWAVHDMTHLHQLSRVLAYQYRDAVGPWKAYLGVLQCNGHGA
jgi:DinB superfamily